MKAAKIIITTIITVMAASSFAATKCDQKLNSGLWGNTNPKVATTVKVANSGATSIQQGTR